MFDVGQKLEIQTLLRAEALVRHNAVRADAEDHGVSRRILFSIATKVVRLERASSGVVLRIEIEDHPLAAVMIERHEGTIVTAESERRGLASEFRNGEFGRD